jgi:hypothetical protein
VREVESDGGGRVEDDQAGPQFNPVPHHLESQQGQGEYHQRRIDEKGPYPGFAGRLTSSQGDGQKGIIGEGKRPGANGQGQ